MQIRNGFLYTATIANLTYKQTMNIESFTDNMLTELDKYCDRIDAHTNTLLFVLM